MFSTILSITLRYFKFIILIIYIVSKISEFFFFTWEISTWKGTMLTKYLALILCEIE